MRELDQRLLLCRSSLPAGEESLKAHYPVAGCLAADTAMSGVLTRWVVLQDHEVVAADLDERGHIKNETVRRWLEDARTAYLDRCPRLRERCEHDQLELRAETASAPPAARLGHPTHVLVSASTTEVSPASIRIAVRIRPLGDDGGDALNLISTAQLYDTASAAALPISDDIRNELIAVESTARNLN